MVLHFCGCGRVGHRRFIFEKDPVSKDAGSFVIFAVGVVSELLYLLMRCGGIGVNASRGQCAACAADWRRGCILRDAGVHATIESPAP